ncbi:hypothetical protein CBF23_006120 [Marinomonas agarivorans]|nr:hypothetical protein CBF23_006120 [Marinomonas agarivorans]
MIDQYLLFALGAVVLATARYGTYFYTIYQGKTKPHAFSWFLWGAVTGVGALAQFELKGGPSAWALAFVAISCLFIALLAFFIGERDYKKSDWLALIGCCGAIPVWHATQNPLLALGIIIVIDVLTYWPTIRKSFHRPETEPPISYGFAGMRYFLMLFAVPDPTWENLMYPFFLMLTDWSFAIYIVIRRWQTGHPLHEYA